MPMIRLNDCGIGRVSATYFPLILSGKMTTSLWSGRKMTPRRSNVLKSRVVARLVVIPHRETDTYVM